FCPAARRGFRLAGRFTARRADPIVLARRLLTSLAVNDTRLPCGSPKEDPMNRAALTERILDIKREKGWTWKYICKEIGGMSPMLITGALLGQMKLTKPLAAKAAEMFGLSKAEQAMLNEVPLRGTPMPPTDPLIYRFYELVMVNGPAWKAL